ncbi:MAG: formate dehydrogenase subunit gamma [Gammaproteobacteria bacterium]|nr:formate dehydrogenase subunit gamma [Gammaproteobacteria bacterium]
MNEPVPRILLERYSANERTIHWIVAVLFVIAALSGLALFHPSLFALSALFGGGTWTRILHPFAGVVMTVAFALLAAAVAKDNVMRAADWQWLRRIRQVLSGREGELPEVGRYNAGQKLLFFVMVISLAGLLVTGIVIWRRYFSDAFPIGAVRLASLAHAFFAFVLILGIIVHVYAAIWVRGSIRAMTRGHVTAGWAFKHHRAWFREKIGHAASPGTRSD